MPPRARTFVALTAAAIPSLIAAGVLALPRQTAPDPQNDAPVLLIEAGGVGSCALYGDGLRCWGTASNGKPIFVRDLETNIVAFDVGESYACAVTSGGALKCWERGGAAVTIAGLGSGVTAVTVGGGYEFGSGSSGHRCAIAGGALWCWGLNTGGQLGDGTTTSRWTPGPVTGLDQNVTRVSGGIGHTCAIVSGGLQCWGDNATGALGDGTTTQRLTPVHVSGLTSGVASVSAGGGFTCALTTAGGVRCWGSNSHGQLGDATTTDRTTPVNVIGLSSGATAISAGAEHACAVVNGEVMCWGRWDFGRLGAGSGSGDKYEPDSVIGLPSAMSTVSAGRLHTCAASAAGQAFCWGHNASFQLGSTRAGEEYTATPVWSWDAHGVMLGTTSGWPRASLPALLDEAYGIPVAVPWPRFGQAAGGVRPAFGDIDGDGRDEVVLGLSRTGFTNGWLAVFDDALHGYRLLQWLQVQWPAYNELNGETFPALGDIDGDGRAEIVVGLGRGAEGWFEIFDDATTGFAHLAWGRVSWWLYQRPESDGRTHPAVGDLDGNGEAEIVFGLGPGSNGWIEIVHGASGAFANRAWVRAQGDAYNIASGTTYPAAGDVDGDGRAEIVLGLGSGGNCAYEVIDDATQSFASLRQAQAAWPAYCGYSGELHPAVGQLDADGGREIVLGLAAYPDNGGWFLVVDDAATGFAQIRWAHMGYGSREAGLGIFPAIGRRW